MDFRTRFVSEDFPFAPTRYYGSKRRQIAWITEQLIELSPRFVLDPMGGTGTVAHALSMMGIPVTFGDLFGFNVRAARGLFLGRPFKAAELDELIDQIVPARGIIDQNFAGVFYPEIENRWLDGLMHTLSAGRAGEHADAVFYALVQACLKKRPFNLFHRANLSLRTSVVQRTFGNAVTWAREFATEVKAGLRDLEKVRNSLVGPVFVQDACSVDKHQNIHDVVYIDPPYFNRDRYPDSYLRRYHFLEGLADYGSWAEKIDIRSSIRCFRPEFAPPEWGCGNDVLEGLECVARKYSRAKIAVSYVESGFPTIDQIRARLLKHRGNVSTKSMLTKTALSKQKRREVLVIATD